MAGRPPGASTARTASACARIINAALVAAGYTAFQHTYDKVSYRRGDSVVVVPGQDNPERRWSYRQWKLFVREYGLTIHRVGNILHMEATKK